MADRLPRLHAITDDETLARPEFTGRARRLVEALGPELALHLRGPRTSGRALLRLAESLAGPAEAAGAALFVNDRVDIAAAVGAAGVQLGERSLAPVVARRLVRRGLWVGCSVHSVEAASAAAAQGADFLLVGTVYPSRSHPGREGLGAAALAAFLAAGCPVVGIGGVTPERVREVRHAGAWGVAVLRGIWSAEQPERAAAEYLEHLRDD